MRAFYPQQAMRAAMATAAIAATIGLSGCQQPAQLRADKGYVRLPAVSGRPAVAYFTVHGGPKDTALLSVTSPVVIRAEMHESMTEGGMAAMRPLRSVPVPAGRAVAFAPGGRHVMFYDVRPTIKPGWTMTLLFTFANNQRVSLDVPVIGPGDPAPAD